MKVRPLIWLAPLAACGTTGPVLVPPVALGKCGHAGLASFVGRKADAALGAEMLRLSGARTLRWAPPRSVVTMDFREDRLTVAYDDAMAVISTRCG